MKRIDPTKCALAFALAAMLASATALADKPSHAGGGKGDKHDRQRGEQRDDHAASRGASAPAGSARFDERHQTLVREYYTEQHRAGRCPPGLAKKHNGCMPPGQAKKWQAGQTLPRDVTFHNVPRPLVTQLAPAPAGHRYVRVGSDILLLSERNGLIVDIIRNLGRT